MRGHWQWAPTCQWQLKASGFASLTCSSSDYNTTLHAITSNQQLQLWLLVIACGVVLESLLLQVGDAKAVGTYLPYP